MDDYVWPFEKEWAGWPEDKRVRRALELMVQAEERSDPIHHARTHAQRKALYFARLALGLEP